MEHFERSMAPRSSISLLMAIAVLLSIALLFTTDRIRPARPGETDPLATPGRATRGISEDDPQLSTALAAQSLPEATRLDGSRTSLAISEADLEMKSALWVEGRVLLPEGVPSDEHAEIVAEGRPFATRAVFRAPILSDGSFRVAFAAGTGLGILNLRARYLYLDLGRAIEPAHPPAHLVLAARLGGVVRGRLIPSEDMPQLRASLAGCKVLATGKLRFDKNETWPAFLQSTNATDELRFELTGLPPRLVYEIRLSSPDAPALAREGVEVSAGGVVDVDLSVRVGAEVSGRVTFDGFFNPEDAEVTAHTRQSDGSVRCSVSAHTDSSGFYALSHVQPGLVTITADCGCGAPQVDLTLGALADGEERTGVDLRIQPESSTTEGAVR